MPKQDQKQFIESLTKIIDYLEEDERKDYDAFEGSNAHKENHIYTHMCRIREWIQEEVNRGKAECLIAETQSLKPNPTTGRLTKIEQMNVIANFQQTDLTFDEKTLLNITEMPDAARKK